MKMIQKTYKFRLYPNKEQERMLANYFGSVRFVYNHFLAGRKEQYEKTKKSSGTDCNEEDRGFLMAKGNQ